MINFSKSDTSLLLLSKLSLAVFKTVTAVEIEVKIQLRSIRVAHQTLESHNLITDNSIHKEFIAIFNLQVLSFNQEAK